MACVAGRDAGMVHRERAKGCRADVAQVTVRVASSRKRDMQSVRVVACAFRGGSVMTISADSRYVAVMNACSQPRDSIEVAGIAIGGRGDMVCTFPRSDGQSVVASHTHA